MLMEWLNLKTSVLHTPEYIGSDPRARATWLNVSLWCAQQENGGRIDGASGWKDRQWQQTCGVSRREVNSADKLLTWDGDALLVWNYPAEKQAQVIQNREIGRLAGLASAAARAKKAASAFNQSSQPTVEPTVQPSSATPVQPNGSTEGNRNGIGIGKELNTSDGVPPPPDAKPASEPAKVARPAAERPRNPLFDALALATGEQPHGLTATAARAIGVALAEIRKASPEVTSDEICRRAENYRLHMPQATLTANALKAHWSRCAVGPTARDTTVPWQRKTAEVDHSKGFFDGMKFAPGHIGPDQKQNHP